MIIFYLVQSINVETNNKKPVKRIHFGLTNFLFTGNNDNGELLSLNFRDMDPIIIKKISNYDDVKNQLKDKKSISVTSELVITLREQDKIPDIIDISHRICWLLSICRGSKISWIYYTCYDNDGSIVFTSHCDMITRPISTASELISSDFPSVKSTTKFLEVAYQTVSDDPILLKYLTPFSNVFVDSRESRGFIQSRGVRLVVLMEMLTKYVLEDPRFEIQEYILDSATQKDTKKEIIKKCREVVHTQIGDSDNIRLSSRWNLPTTDAINTQIRIFNSRLDLINNLSAINRTPFRRLIVKLCEKTKLDVDEYDIKLFVASRNALIHTGEYYCLTEDEDEKRHLPPLNTRHEEYFFILNFIDKIFLKLFGYSGEYNNMRKWGSSLRETI
jgi:hypothetical protein